MRERLFNGSIWRETDDGTRQAALDITTRGYGVSVRSIQYSRTANWRAAATFAMVRGFW